jgi:hypothetical protein
LPSLKKNNYLITSIDNATNKIQNAKFVLSDSVIENMKFLKEFFRQKGLPWAFYLDRDSKFKTTRQKGYTITLKKENIERPRIREL